MKEKGENKMKSIIFKILKTIIYLFPCVVILGGTSDLRSAKFMIGAIFCLFSATFIYITWKSICPKSYLAKIFLNLYKFIGSFIYFIAFCVIMLATLFSGSYEYDVRCTSCDYVSIVSENGIILELEKGREMAKYDRDGWQSCGCRKVISFEQKSSYALEQISLMDNYWTEYSDCRSFLSSYTPYTKAVNFDHGGACFVHTETRHYNENNYAEIVVVYNTKTNRLFYHYYSP